MKQLSAFQVGRQARDPAAAGIPRRGCSPCIGSHGRRQPLHPWADVAGGRRALESLGDRRAGPGVVRGRRARRLVPVFALVIAVVAAVTQPSSAVDLALAAVPVVAFAVWAFVPRASHWWA